MKCKLTFCSQSSLRSSLCGEILSQSSSKRSSWLTTWMLGRTPSITWLGSTVSSLTLQREDIELLRTDSFTPTFTLNMATAWSGNDMKFRVIWVHKQHGVMVSWQQWCHAWQKMTADWLNFWTWWALTRGFLVLLCNIVQSPIRGENIKRWNPNGESSWLMRPHKARFGLTSMHLTCRYNAN